MKKTLTEYETCSEDKKPEDDAEEQWDEWIDSMEWQGSCLEDELDIEDDNEGETAEDEKIVIELDIEDDDKDETAQLVFLYLPVLNLPNY